MAPISTFTKFVILPQGLWMLFFQIAKLSLNNPYFHPFLHNSKVNNNLQLIKIQVIKQGSQR
jgi:hypothetical protein